MVRHGVSKPMPSREPSVAAWKPIPPPSGGQASGRSSSPGPPGAEGPLSGPAGRECEALTAACADAGVLVPGAGHGDGLHLLLQQHSHVSGNQMWNRSSLAATVGLHVASFCAGVQKQESVTTAAVVAISSLMQVSGVTLDPASSSLA